MVDSKPSMDTDLPIPDLLKKLRTSRDGLSSEEAAKRLQQYGRNEIAEEKQSRLLAFLRYFWGPIPWMIEVAAIISAVIQHWDDLAIIVVLLAVNAVVGFWQEDKATNAIELLKNRLALRATVLRDKKWLDVPAAELVPGDITRLRLGNIIPADVRLLTGAYVLVDQSALTGEALPVEKHQGDLAYASSIVRQGEMDGVVTETGMGTYFGRTTKLVEEAQTKSHFQKAIVKIGDYLIVIAVVLVAITTLVGIYRALPAFDLLQFGLVLIVAAIPAAMPAVLSVSMAVGAEALAKKKAIVSKLVAIEELAGVDILCADKTGTITKNELTVGEVRPLTGYTLDDVLLFGTLASRAEDKDPIDDTIIARAQSVAGGPARIAEYEIEGFTPFDPISKRTEAAVHHGTDVPFHVAKGAPQAILQLVHADGAVVGTVTRSVDEFAYKGFRALGVARTDATGGWAYVGLVALYDPPREDSAATIQTAESMGMDVKMVTGDHTAIAREVSGLVGLKTNILTPSSFLNEPDEQAEPAVENADGFAEVFPEHKYRIVELLQKKNHIVCMTGDGVNDAPALKKADAGIAVAGATDAAKSAADVVLTNPGLSVIIDAVKESRKIFQRMTNYALYRITETTRVLVFITLSIIAFNTYPVTALMIVLLALLNDMPIITIAYDNVRYSSTPERWNMKSLLSMSTFLGGVGVVSSFLMLYIGLEVLHLNALEIQSFIFLKLAVAGHLTLFVARTKGPFWSIRPGKSLLAAIVLTKVIATVITVYGVLLPAIGWSLALVVWGYALAWFVAQDFLKVWFYRILAKRENGQTMRGGIP